MVAGSWPRCSRKPSRSSIPIPVAAFLPMEARKHCELVDRCELSFRAPKLTAKEDPVFTLEGVRRLHDWTHASLECWNRAGYLHFLSRFQQRINSVRPPLPP